MVPVGYQCADSRFRHLSRRDLVPLLSQLGTSNRYYELFHLTHESEFAYASAYVVIQLLFNVDWTPRDMDVRWLYYRFDQGSIHDAPAPVVMMCKQDSIDNAV